jgi:ribosomal protein S18 acetylase RimI-like enzyme
MSLAIVPTAECHFDGLYRARDTVAREKRYLAFIQAPPIAQSFAFYRGIVDNDLCHFVAVENGVVLGWCDVLPTHGEARAHVGTLGMGVIAEARRRGIGTGLMQATIAKAWSKGALRIELMVRADNVAAKALYERFGFAVEGINRCAFRVDGEFFDCFAMALVR